MPSGPRVPPSPLVTSAKQRLDAREGLHCSSRRLISGAQSCPRGCTLHGEARMRNISFTLEGSVIRLIPMSEAHVDGLSAVGLEPELWRSTTIQVRTRADMEAYVRTALQAQDAGTALPFTIVECGTDTIVGTTRFHNMAPEHRRLEIGYTWVALPAQRTNVNTESKYLLLRHAFDVLECVRVEFKADAENEPSRRSLLGIGAQFEGIHRSCRISAHRGIRDLAVFSIVAAEWPLVRANLEAKLKARIGVGPL
jgi:N-acetyltransferase